MRKKENKQKFVKKIKTLESNLTKFSKIKQGIHCFRL